MAARVPQPWKWWWSERAVGPSPVLLVWSAMQKHLWLTLKTKARRVGLASSRTLTVHTQLGNSADLSLMRGERWGRTNPFSWVLLTCTAVHTILHDLKTHTSTRTHQGTQAHTDYTLHSTHNIHTQDTVTSLVRVGLFPLRWSLTNNRAPFLFECDSQVSEGQTSRPLVFLWRYHCSTVE